MTALLRAIRALVAEEGPIGIDRYMALALSHPEHGYYITRDPLGRSGDFTTAPEISQMFGELLGLWTVSVWDRMGRPAPVRLVELGPGRGTLMADALRAAGRVPGFLESCRIHLVETSPALRQRQGQALSSFSVTWHTTLDEVPDGPLLLLANEFLDALPIRQFVRGADGWHERLVGLDGSGGLRFGLSPYPVAELQGVPGPAGEVLETSAPARAIVSAVAKRVRAAGGAALFIDYGSAAGDVGDTFQAVRSHRFADPLAAPGDADLTAHVRFGALGREATTNGAVVGGPVSQGAFLRSLGITERAERLSRGATPPDREAIRAALHRLVDPSAMGELFQVMSISDPALGGLPGLPLA